MAPPTPQISPDGAYWWDGQAWRPMPPRPNATAVPDPAPEPAAAVPSWLPAGTELPSQLSSAPAMAAVETASAIPEPAYAEPAPAAWMAPQPPRSSNTLVIIAAVAALALMAGGVGIYAFTQLNRQSSDTSGGNPVAAATPSIAASPSSLPATTLPLTGELGGEYCPVAHPNDAACWKGSFLNTGPGIRQLAMIFVTGGGYDDWFAHHANGTLSGFYTTPGCSVDAAHIRIVCGAVAPGGQVSVYLGGDVTTRGTFRYAVKFADISSGTPVYVDQHPDGTHDVVSWTEGIT